ncbi:hypothetical protein OX284_002310 [Flavobacterium sp. SUN046]|uniref:hypothetical protein n=1 Tax=Flavobacterium sp. SUN046 TaxID=3002440 RepID=UPI002DB71509|nr:hypothetical protein [Flavobacterium sp. SUN046]MEC4048249.1 hypothetical protein [Flavobacterium sp. SUN046]
MNTDLNGFAAEMQGCRLVVLLERGFGGSLREHGFERICGGNVGMPIGCVIGTRICGENAGMPIGCVIGTRI